MIEDRVDWDDGSLFGDGGYDNAEPGSALGIYDLVDCDEWYVYLNSSSARTNGMTKTVCASRRSQIVSKEDSCKAPEGFEGLDLSKGLCGEVPSVAQGVPS
jgi:hypothetical protein